MTYKKKKTKNKLNHLKENLYFVVCLKRLSMQTLNYPYQNFNFIWLNKKLLK